MLESEGADDMIRSLTPLEAYFAIKSLGPDDAIGVLALIEQDQIRTLIDFEAWQGDRLEPADLMIWAEAFRQAGLHVLQKAARAVDQEVLASLFCRRLMLALVPVDEDDEPLPDWCHNPPEGIEPILQTPDRRFWFAARTFDARDELEEDEPEPLDMDERKAILQLVDDLYRDEDFEFVAGILRMAESDFQTAMEEDAYQFKCGRLADLGFPSRERAMEVYEPLPASALGEAGDGLGDTNLRMPAVYLDGLGDGAFIEALGAIEDAESVRAIESALVPLANAVLIADGVDAANLESVQESLRRIRDYLDLALTHGTTAADRISVAQQRLLEHGVRSLFRVGYSIALGLKRRASALPRELLDDDDQTLVDRLRARRPQVEDGPRTLARLEVLAALGLAAVHRIEGDVVPPTEEQTLRVLLATCASQALIGGSAVCEALDASQLKQLRDAVASGRFDPAVVDRAAAELGVPGAQLSGIVTDVVDAVGGLSDPIDPRFVAVVVCRLDD